MANLNSEGVRDLDKLKLVMLYGAAVQRRRAQGISQR